MLDDATREASLLEAESISPAHVAAVKAQHLRQVDMAKRMA